jgi:hypothetical protein
MESDRSIHRYACPSITIAIAIVSLDAGGFKDDSD